MNWEAAGATGQHAPELAEIFDSGTPYAELDTQQRMLLETFSFHNFNTIELAFLHHHAGTMDDNVLQGRVEGFRMTMCEVIDRAGDRVAWARGLAKSSAD